MRYLQSAKDIFFLLNQKVVVKEEEKRKKKKKMVFKRFLNDRTQPTPLDKCRFILYGFKQPNKPHTAVSFYYDKYQISGPHWLNWGIHQKL